MCEVEDVEIVGYAEDGVEAMGMIRETSPDVVFLDLLLPKLDGMRILEKVQEGVQGIEKRPLFIVVSAVTQKDVVEMAMKYGALGVVCKPVDKEMILDACNVHR